MNQRLDGGAGVVARESGGTHGGGGLGEQREKCRRQASGGLVQRGQQGVPVGRAGGCQEATGQGNCERVLRRQPDDGESPVLVRQRVSAGATVVL